MRKHHLLEVSTIDSVDKTRGSKAVFRVCQHVGDVAYCSTKSKNSNPFAINEAFVVQVLNCAFEGGNIYIPARLLRCLAKIHFVVVMVVLFPAPKCEDLQHKEASRSQRPGGVPATPFPGTIHREFVRGKPVCLNNQWISVVCLIVRGKIKASAHLQPGLGLPFDRFNLSEIQLSKLRIEIEKRLFPGAAIVGNNYLLWRVEILI